MSMSGIRDMSVIETPPEARYPVQTFVVEYNDALVREAIMKELARGGTGLHCLQYCQNNGYLCRVAEQTCA